MNSLITELPKTKLIPFLHLLQLHTSLVILLLWLCVMGGGAGNYPVDPQITHRAQQQQQLRQQE